MATITRENIGELNDRITVKIAKEDYLPSFEKSLKNYGKSASIPGFRKGMVPSGVIKKMHGQSVFTDEVLKAVEKELTKFMEQERLDIFAQPLPLSDNDPRQLDVNNPAEYSFGFEVGLKPDFTVADLSNEKILHYQVEVTDDMVAGQVDRLRKAYGKKKDPEGGEEEENIEKAELNEDFFKAAYPGKELKTEEELKAEIRKEIEKYWEGQSRNQMQHEIYHRLLEHSHIKFPESFLKRWLETNTGQPKSAEDVDKEYPVFINQLKWTLINDRIGAEQKLNATADDMKDFAKKQLFSYMGMQALSDEQPWMEEYVNKMMKDRKFIDDASNRIRTEKLFNWATDQVQKEEKNIGVDDFNKLTQEHQHQH